MTKRFAVSPATLADICKAQDARTLTASDAKTLYRQLAATGYQMGYTIYPAGDGPEGDLGEVDAYGYRILRVSLDAVIKRLGLERIADPATLTAWVDAALAAHPDSSVDYLMGSVMKASKGKADPHAVRALLTERRLRE